MIWVYHAVDKRASSIRERALFTYLSRSNLTNCNLNLHISISLSYEPNSILALQAIKIDLKLSTKKAASIYNVPYSQSA